MADKAKHAYGSRKNLNAAIASGAVDAYDLLFLNGEGETPAIGWMDKNGNPIVIAPTDELAKFETQIETELASKVSTEEMANLETRIATKADSTEVDTKIDQAMSDSVSVAKSYVDDKVEEALNGHSSKKYEITSVPEGTLIKMSESEIRVFCPSNTKWEKQSVGATGNSNMYYMGFKAFAPAGAVSFKEGDKGVIVDEMFDFNGDFAGTDEYGRNYSICWLALASYDATSDTWTYFGKNSSAEKYIGWTYVVEWYDVNGKIIASDGIRINLSNETCHSSIEPYYVGDIKKEIDTKIEEKIAEVNSSYEIIEF